MISEAKAFQLYKQYKTETLEYKAFAAYRGYTVGELNAKFAVQLHAKKK